MEFNITTLNDKRLEPLMLYLNNPDITNIDWHGGELWLKDVYNRCYKVDDPNVTSAFINDLISVIANSQGNNFNQDFNILETDSKEYHMRITAIHNSVSMGGNLLLLRKTTEQSRFTYEYLIKNGYISEKNLNFIINCVICGCNIMIAGLPEAGKTEFSKYISMYIPDDEVVVTIEDALEWYYKKLKPQSPSISLKVNDRFNYVDAIKECMRLNASRILFTEVRSNEIEDLAALWTSGVPGISTTHSGHYRSIPDRLVNLLKNKNIVNQVENDIYEHLDVGIVIKKRKNNDGTSTRYVDEIGFFERKNKINRCIDFVIAGQNVSKELPDKIKEKLEACNISNPYELKKEQKI